MHPAKRKSSEAPVAQTASSQPVHSEAAQANPPKPSSINEILKKAWQEHMNKRGLDPNNPPKQTFPEQTLVESKLPQQCGQYLVEEKIQKMFEGHLKTKYPAPQNSPDPVELPKPQYCGQHYLAQRAKKRGRDELADEPKKAAEKSIKSVE